VSPIDLNTPMGAENPPLPMQQQAALAAALSASSELSGAVAVLHRVFEHAQAAGPGGLVAAADWRPAMDRVTAARRRYDDAIQNLLASVGG
jgi:hypothetical protein